MKNTFYKFRAALVCFLVIPFMFVLTGCPDYTEDQAELIGNVKYCKSHDDNNKAIVYSVVWDGDENHTVFEIPDQYQGRNIVSLGGHVTGFQVQTDSKYWFYNQQIGNKDDTNMVNVDDSTVIKDIVFTLKLNQYVSRISGSYSSGAPKYLVFKKESGFVMYRVLFNVECPESNNTFYSRDGKLFKRRDNQPEDSLTYAVDVKNGVEPDFGDEVICTVKNSDVFATGIFCVDMDRYKDRERKHIEFKRLYEYQSNWRITFLDVRLTEDDFYKLWASGSDLNEGGCEMTGRYMYVLCDHNASNSENPTEGLFMVRFE